MAKKRTKKQLTEFQKATKKLGSLRKKKTKKRVDPLWTPDDGITYSILSRFANCRQRFHIAQVQGWKPKGFALPLEFGNIFHHLVEAQSMGYSTEQLKKLPTNYVESKIESEPDMSADKIRELSMLAAIAFVTFEQYVAFWEQNAVDFGHKETLEKKFNWVGKEIPFDINYRMTTGREVRLRGKMDGVFNPQRGDNSLWLFETKTKGRIDEDGITRGLHKDLQTGLYLLALWKQYRNVPTGVVYNVIRRTQLKPRVKETPETFAERVFDDISKRPDFYFMRWVRPIDRQELEEFRTRQLDPALFQLMTWWDSIKHDPMNPFTGANGEPNIHHWERPFGQFDPFENSARGDFFDIIIDGNYQYYEQKQYAFPELEAEDDVHPYLKGIKKNG